MLNSNTWNHLLCANKWLIFERSIGFIYFKVNKKINTHTHTHIHTHTHRGCFTIVDKSNKKQIKTTNSTVVKISFTES